jgi:hypothetical protein
VASERTQYTELPVMLLAYFAPLCSGPRRPPVCEPRDFADVVGVVCSRVRDEEAFSPAPGGGRLLALANSSKRDGKEEEEQNQSSHGSGPRGAIRCEKYVPRIAACTGM